VASILSVDFAASDARFLSRSNCVASHSALALVTLSVMLLVFCRWNSFRSIFKRRSLVVNWYIGLPRTGSCQEVATVAIKSLRSAHIFRNLNGEWGCLLGLRRLRIIALWSEMLRGWNSAWVAGQVENSWGLPKTQSSFFYMFWLPYWPLYQEYLRPV